MYVLHSIPLYSYNKCYIYRYYYFRIIIIIIPTNNDQDNYLFKISG